MCKYIKYVQENIGVCSKNKKWAHMIKKQISFNDLFFTFSENTFSLELKVFSENFCLRKSC